jgi:hypothetical protein
MSVTPDPKVRELLDRLPQYDAPDGSNPYNDVREALRAAYLDGQADSYDDEPNPCYPDVNKYSYPHE